SHVCACFAGDWTRLCVSPDSIQRLFDDASRSWRHSRQPLHSGTRFSLDLGGPGSRSLLASSLFLSRSECHCLYRRLARSCSVLLDLPPLAFFARHLVAALVPGHFPAELRRGISFSA